MELGSESASKALDPFSVIPGTDKNNCWTRSVGYGREV